MKKVLVVHSGGLDSTCCLKAAIERYEAENVYTLTADYGQKHSIELECQKKIVAKWLPEGHSFYVGLEPLFVLNGGALVNPDEEIPEESYAEQLKKKPDGVVSTYVPFRNGVFLSVATAYAYQLGCFEIWAGMHADDAAGNAYPDCSTQFAHALGQAISLGTANKVHLVTPLITKTKTQVVKYGIDAGMTQEDFDMTHSCYEGIEGGCGKCGTCIDRANALHVFGLKDHGR